MNKGTSSFTLIELLIVVGIIAILAAAVILVLNPAELLAQSRDGTRVEDLQALETGLGMYIS
ncbi:MAG TPA: prepilin-type N-terminal cleavage/methylation domain-containing protein, partial [Candidatus Tyrphobacter sp.]|nr:prepilin-type N-terminal cleavage/methylation domain-containing protein [Candidatus Tyrphobacter sp.]